MSSTVRFPAIDRWRARGGRSVMIGINQNHVPRPLFAYGGCVDVVYWLRRGRSSSGLPGAGGANEGGGVPRSVAIRV